MFGLVFILVFAIFGVHIWAIVDVARRSDQNFKAIKQDKTLWLILVLLAGLPAALVYLAGIRPRLDAAPPQLMLPGWYPDPATAGYLRYHDGQGWTAAMAPMLPPAQAPYPAQPHYPPQQGYPSQAYPPQAYPPQAYPPQQAYPAQPPYPPQAPPPPPGGWPPNHS